MVITTMLGRLACRARCLCTGLADGRGANAGTSLLERVNAIRKSNRAIAPAMKALKGKAPARHGKGLSLPLRWEPVAAHVEHWMVQTWFKTFPHGARVRKLRRDIAFRMPPLANGEKVGKPNELELLQFLERLEARGVVELTTTPRRRTDDRGDPKPVVRPPAADAPWRTPLHDARLRTPRKAQ